MLEFELINQKTATEVVVALNFAKTLKLVTHNTAHFNRLVPHGLQLEDWMV